MKSWRVAIDLGAGSGRALVGSVGARGVHFQEAHRFQYAARPSAGHLRWDAARLFEGVTAGLQMAAALAADHGARLASVGVDSWGVDYGLLDREGRLVEEPICYRDERTEGMLDEVFRTVPRAEIFERTGIQFLRLNTLYQLLAHARAGVNPDAARLLLIPDLCHHFLCGAQVSEHTNATTTQLLGLDGRWDEALFSRLGLPRPLMPDVVPAGRRLGALRPERRAETTIDDLEVIAPATHDTGSAVVGTPLLPGWAYISSGTWSLVGVERDAPLTGEAVAAANFTNEGGAYGSVRFLKNVMGLWLLESCRKEWRSQARVSNIDSLLAGVASRRQPAGLGFGFIYPDADRFFAPKSMPLEIGSALRASGFESPEDEVGLTQVILDSLALRYASVVRTIERLTGREIPGIHVVGGGSQNDALNQATANAAGKPVLAGPVEATAIGNLLVQSVAGGEIASVREGRRLVSEALPPRRFEPRDEAYWREAALRYAEIEARA